MILGHLHLVMLGDAVWITALLIGIMIESRLSRSARRRRGSLEECPPGWLTANGRRTFVKSPAPVSIRDHDLY
jgi:hypothetical protein